MQYLQKYLGLLPVLLDLTRGYKTYGAAIGLLGLAVWQFSQADPAALPTLLQGLGLLGLRHAITPPPPAPPALSPLDPPLPSAPRPAKEHRLAYNLYEPSLN